MTVKRDNVGLISSNKRQKTDLFTEIRFLSVYFVFFRKMNERIRKAMPTIKKVWLEDKPNTRKAKPMVKKVQFTFKRINFANLFWCTYNFDVGVDIFDFHVFDH